MDQKIPASLTLPQTIYNEVRRAIDRLGKALPATVVSVTGAIVTVNFELSDISLPQVQMPLFGPEYIRYPIQKGDKGVCFPADVYIGGMSGLGSGTADSSRRGNLSTLVFFPIGNKTWSSVDPDAVTVYGPNGVVLRDKDSKTVATLVPSGLTVDSANGSLSFSINGSTFSMDSTGITLSFGGNKVVIDSTGVQINGKYFLTHEHSGVTTGSGTSGPVA